MILLFAVKVLLQSMKHKKGLNEGPDSVRKRERGKNPKNTDLTKLDDHFDGEM